MPSNLLVGHVLGGLALDTSAGGRYRPRPMRLEDLEIDPRTWNEADEGRRREWRAAMDELLGASDLRFKSPGVRLRIAVATEGATLTLTGGPGDAGAAVAEAHVPWDALTKQVREYVDIVRQMDSAESGRGSARLEALDMAKKLVHDDAARRLRGALSALEVDHETARRLFTLLFALRVDTSRLMGYRSHRPVR